MDQVTRRLSADRCTLYLVDHARNELVSRVGILPELAEIRLRIGEGVAGQVAATGAGIRVSASEGGARILKRIDALTGYETRNVLAVPVRGSQEASRGVTVAVIQLLNKADGDFDAEDERLLDALAVQVGALLEASSLGSQLHPGQRHPLAFRFNHIIGESAAMQKVYDRTTRAARAEVTVLVRGESGSGKELIARAIHDNSERRDGPFVKVDCAALPESLIENELFGHEKGAYTGADRAREGKVETAQGGTLFLDEVGELSLSVQGKLLRLLQDRAYLRVGGTRARKADVRFVCATHRDLETAVSRGTFRNDLYYRLRVVEIALPSLRERGGGDLDRLIDHFLFTFAQRHRRPRIHLAPEVRPLLHAWSWPGNVRELEHCIESAVVLAPGDVITPDLLPFSEQLRAPAADPSDPSLFITDLRSLREVEGAYVRHVLRLCEDNRSEAARVLGIGRNTLLRKLKRAVAQDEPPGTT
ncbi:MAG: sigma-54-dependent Fis family transcriptional regulator [Alphaproteobacteria bacterium]|nr:sigma-54-dependent Fis family transcriptional regulator [Alphaproteobacteria bacterium]